MTKYEQDRCKEVNKWIKQIKPAHDLYDAGFEAAIEYLIGAYKSNKYTPIDLVSVHILKNYKDGKE
jgi:hypothetical protein